MAALNQGASFTDLGLTAERANELAASVPYVGEFLTELRSVLRKNGAKVRNLLKTEQPRLWIVVAAGNDPDGDVAAVTRGGSARADVDRLMSATSANIVRALRRSQTRSAYLALSLMREYCTWNRSRSWPSLVSMRMTDYVLR